MAISETKEGYKVKDEPPN